jgi:hypothetical protein
MEMCEFYAVKESVSIWHFLQNYPGSAELSPHPQTRFGFIWLRLSPMIGFYEHIKEPSGC